MLLYYSNIIINLDLKKYIGATVPLDKMHTIFKANNVDIELSTLYRDIIITLMDNIFTTYLGDDITDKDGQKKHFYWAWEYTKSTFSNEGIILNNDSELADYFYGFIADVYYDATEKDSFVEDNLKKLWFYLFNPVREKSQSDIDVFIELYEMFTASIFN